MMQAPSRILDVRAGLTPEAIALLRSATHFYFGCKNAATAVVGCEVQATTEQPRTSVAVLLVDLVIPAHAPTIQEVRAGRRELDDGTWIPLIDLQLPGDHAAVRWESERIQLQCLGFRAEGQVWMSLTVQLLHGERAAARVETTVTLTDQDQRHGPRHRRQ
jgi:hypothetical protein